MILQDIFSELQNYINPLTYSQYHRSKRMTRQYYRHIYQQYHTILYILNSAALKTQYEIPTNNKPTQTSKSVFIQVIPILYMKEYYISMVE